MLYSSANIGSFSPALITPLLNLANPSANAPTAAPTAANATANATASANATTTVSTTGAAVTLHLHGKQHTDPLVSHYRLQLQKDSGRLNHTWIHNTYSLCAVKSGSLNFKKWTLFTVTSCRALLTGYCLLNKLMLWRNQVYKVLRNIILNVYATWNDIVI